MLSPMSMTRSPDGIDDLISSPTDAVVSTAPVLVDPLTERGPNWTDLLASADVPAIELDMF